MQEFRPSGDLLGMMESFRQMTNDCIRIGIDFENKNSRNPSMKKLSLLTYGDLRRRYGCQSGFVLCAISKASGILSARRKSIKRGFPSKTPYLSKPMLVSCYGFKIEHGNLAIRLDATRVERIPLNPHTESIISDPDVSVRAFTITPESVSLCISKDVKEREHAEILGVIAVDRNLRNLTVGNGRLVTYYDVSKLVKIAQNSRTIISSFKRADARIRGQIASKYGRRRSSRTKQLLNLVSKRIVGEALAKKNAIVFEQLTGIRKLYRRGNGQGRSFRARMNSWPFGEFKRQVEYKAAWAGVPVITLTRSETRGTTMDCPRCGERLQVPIQGDHMHNRQLWCEVCGIWRDRDLIAVLNISRRGWLRFDHSSTEDEARETMKRNAEHDREPLILRVDASKLHLRNQMQ